MWFGQYIGLHASDLDESLYVVNFRFDFFEIPQSNGVTCVDILRFISDSMGGHNVKFLNNFETSPNWYGIDNIFAGPGSKIRKIVRDFHFELDRIMAVYPHIHHQEYMVKFEAERINTDISQ